MMHHTYRFSAAQIAELLTEEATEDEQTPPGHYEPFIHFQWDQELKEVFATVTLIPSIENGNPNVH